MKRLWLLLVLAVPLILGAWLWSRPTENRAARRVAETAFFDARRAGFKLEYHELLPTLTPAETVRAHLVTNAGFAVQRLRGLHDFPWMLPVTRGTARCGWQSEGPWNELEATLEPVTTQLDAAVTALNTDTPLIFAPIQRGTLLLPHLAALKALANALTARMALALRAGQADQAWTNLLAVTDLATRFQPEPAEVSYLVRAGLVRQAFAATWEALQTNAWSEVQLADLTRRWSAVRLFEGVPEVAALERAQLRTLLVNLRVENRTNNNVIPEVPRLLRLGLTHPHQAWIELRSILQNDRGQRDYAQIGSYLDEAFMIQFYREREVELRQAVAQSTWHAMQPLPGVTNPVFLQFPLSRASSYSPLQSMVNLRALTKATGFYTYGSSAQTLSACLADTEALRRVLLTALAIQRTRLQTGRWPESLAEVPDTESDFATGAPLHYRLEPGHRPILYSVGLDLVDNDGLLRSPNYTTTGRREFDLVWPRSATLEELAAAVQVQQSLPSEVPRQFYPQRPKKPNRSPKTAADLNSDTDKSTTPTKP